MVWRRVHAERPSCSTSGGQSAGISRDAVACAGGVVVAILEGFAVPCFAMANHEDTDVHDRHLHFQSAFF